MLPLRLGSGGYVGDDGSDHHVRDDEYEADPIIARERAAAFLEVMCDRPLATDERGVRSGVRVIRAEPEDEPEHWNPFG
jgi:hypothetical protein